MSLVNISISVYRLKTAYRSAMVGKSPCKTVMYICAIPTICNWSVHKPCSIFCAFRRWAHQGCSLWQSSWSTQSPLQMQLVPKERQYWGASATYNFKWQCECEIDWQIVTTLDNPYLSAAISRLFVKTWFLSMPGGIWMRLRATVCPFHAPLYTMPKVPRPTTSPKWISL